MIKKINLLFFSLALFLSDVSAQSNIPSEFIPTQEVSVNITLSPHFFWGYPSNTIKMHLGENLLLNIDNSTQLYHSGDLINYDLNKEPDLRHTICTAFYSDSWVPWNHTFSIEEENSLNNQTGNPLTYHFKAIRPGKTYIYFCTLSRKLNKFGEDGTILMPSWLCPVIIVDVATPLPESATDSL